MEIQQHDGVVVDVAGSRQGFAKLLREGEVLQGRGRRQGLLSCCPPPCPPLYRPPRGAPALGDAISQGGRRPGGVECPPRQVVRPPPRVSNPRRRGGKGGRTSPLGAGSPPTSAHGALRDRWPHPVDPRDPSGGPGTIPNTPETFPMAETALPI